MTKLPDMVRLESDRYVPVVAQVLFLLHPLDSHGPLKPAETPSANVSDSLSLTIAARSHPVAVINGVFIGME